MICQKCLKDFPSEMMEASHDIPKYVGGMDQDGRHSLCKSKGEHIGCHDKYEREILSRCFMLAFKREIPLSEFKERGTLIPYMTAIKNSVACRECFYLALKIKKEWWENGDTRKD